MFPHACHTRRDIVCNLSGHSGRTLYLYNQPDPDRTTSETPFFCYSHLIMKIKVRAAQGCCYAVVSRPWLEPRGVRLLAGPSTRSAKRPTSCPNTAASYAGGRRCSRHGHAEAAVWAR
jgi:hypothetical protein